MFATRAAVSAETTKAGGASHQAVTNRETKKPESVVQMILNTTEKNILFADLTREQKRGVVDIMWKVNVGKGVKLITQGAVNDDVFYVVETGTSSRHMHACMHACMHATRAAPRIIARP
jgi:hypothetical protein